MAPLKLTSTYTPNETNIPNIFLDTFMPSANGEFVKVYLCLLRMFGDPNHEPATLADIADLLNHTEGDVVRAIKYWEKEGLLSVIYKDDCPVDITLLPIEPSFPFSAPVQVIPQADMTPRARRSYKNNNGNDKPTTVKPTTVSPDIINDDNDEKDEEAVRQILFVSEQFIGKTLTSSDINSILYIYGELGFSEELIEYLLEYCVSNEKRSLRYIQKVAIEWNKEGITTVEQAKEQHTVHSRRIYAVMNAFGLTDRKPGKAELDYITRWYDEYGFTEELVTEACSRTLLALQKADFKYTDAILLKWKDKNVCTLSDVRALDITHAKKENASQSSDKLRQTGGTSGNQRSANTRTGNNRFNNFSQRSYDFDAIEKQFAGKKD